MLNCDSLPMQLAKIYDTIFPWFATVITAAMTVALFKVSRWFLTVFPQKMKGFWRRKVPKFAQVYVLQDADECDRILQAYKKNYPLPFNFLGLDCEWVNQKGIVSHPVALLQIATPLNDCFLIRLCKMKGSLPVTLKELLEDKNILKFGVGIQDDAKKLNGTYGLNVSGCVDLRHVTLRCQSSQGSSVDQNVKGQSKMGLDGLCKRYLGVQMDKSWRVRCSNWEADSLSDRQIEYAAHDAIVAVHIFLALAKIKTRHDKARELPLMDRQGRNDGIKQNVHCNENLCCDSEEGLKITLSLNKYEVDPTKGYVTCVVDMLSDSIFYQRAISLCKGIVDLGFKNKFIKNPSIKKEGFLQNKGLKKPYKSGATMRKSPLYTNCQLVAPDGARLCILDRKKAEWYLDKEIGELISEDPYTVRLKFEPSARPLKDDDYYLTFKDNVCVVCGKSDSYLRKNIVPHEYRRYFPDCMKDHHSHDVVLMCPECHRLSSIFDEQLRQKLAREYDAPLGNKELAKFFQDPIRVKVRSSAKALLYAGDKLPKEREQELKEILKDYYNIEELTQELIKDASIISVQKENVNFKSHGEVVIKQVTKQKKLLEFEKMWRVHFLETLNPRFLPELWSVEHRFDKMKEALGRLDLQ